MTPTRPPLKKRLKEAAANNRVILELAGLVHLVRAALPFGTAGRLAALASACRRLSTRPLRSLLRRMLRPWLRADRAASWREHRVGWHLYYGERELDSPDLTYSLVIKEPGEGGEKGVLYAAFEYNWARLIAHHDARAVLERYFLIGASSWSPTDYALMANFAGLSQDPAFLGISNMADMDAYRVMSPVVEPLPILACDWIDPSWYEPRPREDRDVDLLMVASFMQFKRHWLLFEALRDMPAHLRVVLIGERSPGRGREEILAEAREAGAPQDLEVIENATIETVTDYQCRARASAILSRREGSCVAVTESMFADSPVALMEDAHIGSMAYINAETGTLLSRDRMANQLMELIESDDGRSPRRWAVENVSCQRTTKRLNERLRNYSERTGLPWTRDVVPLCWRPRPMYLRLADQQAMRGATETLEHELGVKIVQGRSPTS